MKLLNFNIPFTKLFINPFLLGAVITIAFFFFTQKQFDKFRINKVSSTYVMEKSRNYFHDLDSDGFSEWIELGFDKNDENFPYYIIYRRLEANFSRLIDDQHNIKHKWLGQTNAFFGDVDKDNQDEILFLTYMADSLFLFCGDPADDISTLFETFLDTVSFREGSPDFTADILAVYDFDDDGCNDVLVRINAGHSLAPREYYIFNYHKDALIRSNMGFAHLSGATLTEIPGYGPVILPIRSYSPQNVKIPATFTDTISWMALFDRSLGFIFPPVPNPGYKTNLQSRLKVEGTQAFIYSLFFDHDRKNNPPSLKKFDMNGKLVAQRRFDNEYFPVLTLVSNPVDMSLYLKAPDHYTLQEILPDLSLGKKKTCFLSESPRVTDLNGDGKPEVISVMVDSKYSLSICQANLSNTVSITLGPGLETMIFSPLVTEDGLVNLAVQTGNNLHNFKFERNPLYYWNYMIYAGTWLGLSLFFLLLFQVQKKMLRKKYEQERKMMELELMTIKNQVDPHFMFNTMNSIGSFILKEEKRKAYDYLISFSQMIRSTLSHARDVSLSLKDEVAFVESYLELEKLRMSTDFQFSVRVDPQIDTSVQIPKMIIQTFSENAVKHGLKQKKGPGRLDISINLKGADLLIHIVDNGIGREGSERLKTHGTGQGENIIRQIVSLFNRLHDTHVSFTVEDLKNETGDPAGTKVIVIIPYRNG